MQRWGLWRALSRVTHIILCMYLVMRPRNQMGGRQHQQYLLCTKGYFWRYLNFFHYAFVSGFTRLFITELHIELLTVLLVERIFIGQHTAQKNEIMTRLLLPK